MRHPLALYVLFGTEMWERFCYYGMRALLVLYFVEHLGWQPSDANSVFKWYTSLIYLAPLFGGFLADRYFGLRASIISGGVLMAIGSFFLTQKSISVFYVGLGFLIVGNGFFKPNITTLLGRMYVPGDARRDRAFTIFYMGINLGGFLGPIVCGQWLRAKYGFAYGFGATGVAMLLALVMFIGFHKQVTRDVLAAGNTLARGALAGKESIASRRAASDEAKAMAAGFAAAAGRVFTIAMGVLFGLVIPVLFVIRYLQGGVSLAGVFMPVAVGGITIWMTASLLSVKGASRDKSMVIFILFTFQLLFWMAFEQQGSALNLWAAFNTERKLAFVQLEAEPYQSVNSLAIIAIAPIFALVWGRLSMVGREPSTPMKMAISMVFMGLASMTMVGAGVAENATESRVALDKVPDGIDVSQYDAGRLHFDADKHELVVKGTFPTFVMNDMLQRTVDPRYIASVDALVRASEKASPENPASGKIEGLPASYDPTASLEKVRPSWDPASSTLTVRSNVEPPVRTMLVSDGAPPEWRMPLRELGKKSDAARVTGFWLIVSYILATLGELCISPVGYSMVTKLAPTRFASLFMGVWLLSNSVAQYIGGSIGESWGKVTPTSYFMIFVASSVVGAVLLFLLVRPVRRLMHDVH